MVGKAKWTILTYIAAHNNLEDLGMRSLEQIIDVGSTKQVMHGVLYDGTKGATRYIVGDPGRILVEEQKDNFDSGDPDALIETAQWLFEQYPAERYGLVLWSHGSGWQPEEIQEVAKQARQDDQVDDAESKERASTPGSLVLFRSSLTQILRENAPNERAILFDDGSGHSLDTLELQNVMRKIQKAIGQPLDILGMDACLMASLEVAYQIRGFVRCLVASQELVPGFSWPYAQIYGKLKSDPDCPADQFAVSIVQHYTDYYRANPPGAGDVTKVALNLSEIDLLAQAIDALGKTLAEDMNQSADQLWEAQVGARQQESIQDTREPNKFWYYLWDIRSLATRLVDAGTSSAVREAANKVIDSLAPDGPFVLSEGHHGDWFEGIGGVSIYLMPPGTQRISPYYDCVALSKDTHWNEMLRAYHEYYA